MRRPRLRRIDELQARQPASFCLDEEAGAGPEGGGHGGGGQRGQPLAAGLAARLQQALEAFEQCSGGAAALAQQVRSTELAAAVAEAEDSMQLLAAHHAAAAGQASGGCSGSRQYSVSSDVSTELATVAAELAEGRGQGAGGLLCRSRRSPAYPPHVSGCCRGAGRGARAQPHCGGAAAPLRR
jgi:hypothetical protein